ncbi:hypothetical protein ElyMa_002484400 [Elysia marginata]|uniref:Uncharacterized protein n=1 Tax=Elysia marginata TaxID=1093978 RepID=A0AAV4GMV1_9GAST|nr:hypothetical protein ElyMa_002484400 [Elysia marginata]
MKGGLGLVLAVFTQWLPPDGLKRVTVLVVSRGRKGDCATPTGSQTHNNSITTPAKQLVSQPGPEATSLTSSSTDSLTDHPDLLTAVTTLTTCWTVVWPVDDRTTATAATPVPPATTTTTPAAESSVKVK